MLRENKTKLLFFIIFFVSIAISTFLIIKNNNSLIFEFNILNKSGDQRLYIQLGKNILKQHFVPHIYTVGYSTFLLPIIFFLKNPEWENISRWAVIIQSFFLFPVTIAMLALIFRKNIKRYPPKVILSLTTTLILLFSSELLILRGSQDPIPFYLFFGLIPYSETWAIFLLTSLYFLLICKPLYPRSNFLWLSIGILSSFIVSVRVIFLILVLPVLLYVFFLFLQKNYKKAGYYLAGLVIGYLPQATYNFLATGKVFFSSYSWDWERKQEKYTDLIRRLYNTDTHSIFSLDYFQVNILVLWEHYFHFFLLAVLIIFLISYLKRLSLNRLDLFYLATVFSALVYVVIYLSYWWSSNRDCIDRFLMPLTFFLVIPLSYSINLLNEKHDRKNINQK